MLSSQVMAVLRSRRLDRGMSAQELADFASAAGHEMSRSMVAKLENGLRDTLSMEEFVALCLALELNPIEVLKDAGIGADIEERSWWQVRRTWYVKARTWDEAVTSAQPGRHTQVDAHRMATGPVTEIPPMQAQE